MGRLKNQLIRDAARRSDEVWAEQQIDEANYQNSLASDPAYLAWLDARDAENLKHRQEHEDESQ